MTVSKLDRLRRELEGAIAGGDFELAGDVIEDMLEIEPDNDMFWNSKGVVLSKLGEYQEALDAFDQALEIKPNVSKIWYSKGAVLLEMGHLRQGLACFYKALDIEPGFIKARERFIQTLDMMEEADRMALEETEEEEKVSGVDSGEVPEEEEEPEVISDIPPEKVSWKGSGKDYVDDLFSEEEDLKKEEEEEEDLGGKEDEPEEEEEILDFEDIEEEEDWGDIPEGRAARKGRKRAEEEGSRERREKKKKADKPSRVITCKCGNRIMVWTEERPARFECEQCGRTGTLYS